MHLRALLRVPLTESLEAAAQGPAEGAPGGQLGLCLTGSTGAAQLAEGAGARERGGAGDCEPGEGTRAEKPPEAGGVKEGA